LPKAHREFCHLGSQKSSIKPLNLDKGRLSEREYAPLAKGPKGFVESQFLRFS